ncbi:MAG: outer membrane beta-barrel protein [Kofleriaceae bacterium]|nr:MAG: outer membrane beta-barrel protein [Kofleriaceae bacterium]MBZ0232071.1 hypothetical protein [Kofleriaceae bacterium]
MLKSKIGAAVFFGAALVASGAAAQETPDPQDPIEPNEPTIPADPQDPADPVEPAEPVPSDPVPTSLPPAPPAPEPVIVSPPPQEPTPVDVDVHVHDLGEEEESQPIGISLTVGGGVIGFTDESMRDTTSAGGMWDVRAAIGTRSPIAVEAAYIGSAQDINSVGLDDSAVLLGTGVEAVARVNLLPKETVNPYFFGGAAWKRYDLTNTDTNTSDVNDTDNLIEIPVGVGLSYRVSGFLLDVRGSLRMATEEDLIRQDVDTEDVRLHAWTAGAKLGYEF